MNPTYSICYISKANSNLTIEEISELNNVSGILLHSLGNFFQVLEGEEKHIENLYENHILKDSRHSNVFEIYRRNISSPIFSTYLSHFQAITTSEQLKKIHNYLESNRRIPTSDKLSRLLKPFIIFE